MANPEFTRAYTFRDPFMPQIMCRPNCCLFCDECTDIYYDSGGLYGIVCLKQGDFETGMLGKCEMFSEDQKNEIGGLGLDDRDIAKKPIRITKVRYGMGYGYHDWICPSCKRFLSYEPNWRNIPKRCPECGQLLDKLTREEAEE